MFKKLFITNFNNNIIYKLKNLFIIKFSHIK